MPKVVRIDREEEVSPETFRWRIAEFNLEGVSRQPVCDAARQLKPLLGDQRDVLLALFRKGSTEPSRTASLDWAASHTVKEPSKGHIHFARYEDRETILARFKR